MSSADNLPLAPNTLEERIALIRAEAEGKTINVVPLNGNECKAPKGEGVWAFDCYRYDIEPDKPKDVFFVLRQGGVPALNTTNKAHAIAKMVEWNGRDMLADHQPYTVARYTFAEYVDG